MSDKQALLRELDEEIKAWAEVNAVHDTQYGPKAASLLVRCREALAAPADAGSQERLNKQVDYSIALQRAIEHHCRGEEVPPPLSFRCPHHAMRLNNRLAALAAPAPPLSAQKNTGD